jgi:hypothetical protein
MDFLLDRRTSHDDGAVLEQRTDILSAIADHDQSSNIFPAAVMARVAEYLRGGRGIYISEARVATEAAS